MIEVRADLNVTISTMIRVQDAVVFGIGSPKESKQQSILGGKGH